jgi:CubicO group peptidase (beta-lactamase class C family)
MTKTIFLFLLSFLLPNNYSAKTSFDDNFIKKAFTLNLTPGMSVAVVQGDKIIFSKGYGYADLGKKRAVTPETMFYIASTTKSFTAFAIALLSKQGRFNMDASLAEYFPELQLKEPLSADSISIRDLIICGHGIAVEGPITFRTAYSGDFTPDQILQLLSQYHTSENGKTFEYSNLGYNIASIAMDEHLGISWKEILRQEIFDKLAMDNTSAYISRIDKNNLALPYTVDGLSFRKLDLLKDDKNMHAAGGHVSSTLDLAKWLTIHMNKGRLNGRQIFPADVVRETHQKQIDQDKTFAGFKRFGWGLGWDLGLYEQDTLIHRFGSFIGYRSHISFMPQHKIAVVVLVNEGNFGSALADAVAKNIYDTLLKKQNMEERTTNALAELQSLSQRGREMLQKEKEKIAARSQDLLHPLKAYTGTFFNEKYGTMLISLNTDQLYVEMGLAHSVATVYNNQKNQLRVELTGGGKVITVNFKGEQANTLVFANETFDRQQ